MCIKVRELDILKLTDDPGVQYPFEEAWIITPTTDPEIHTDHRHQRLEVWAPDPENPGEGICIARLSDGLRPCYGKLLILALQGVHRDQAAAQGGNAPPAPVLFQDARFVWCRDCQWVGLASELIPEHWNDQDDHGQCPVCQGGSGLLPIPHAASRVNAWRAAEQHELANQLSAAVVRANDPNAPEGKVEG